MDTRAEQEISAGDRAGQHHDEPGQDAEWCTQIAGRIAGGDAQAEALLIKRVRPGLLMVLSARCPNDRELAADLCQETLIIVLNRLRSRSMEDPSRVAAFAAQTARQLAFDAHRRFAARKTTVDTDAVLEAADEAACETPTDNSAERASVNALVRRLVAELSHDRDREILRRFYLLEQDKSEICSSFGIAPAAFDQLVFRARARLRKMLDARGVGSRDLLCVFFVWIPESWLH
jgi:RNA polymerase sigma-70 factor (ECF subfamily)